MVCAYRQSKYIFNGFGIEYELEDIVFVNNTASKGAAVYFIVNTNGVVSQTYPLKIFLYVIHATFVSNFGIEGAVLYTSSVDYNPTSATQLNVEMSGSSLVSNFGRKGAALYITNKAFFTQNSFIRIKNTSIIQTCTQLSITGNEAVSVVYIQKYSLLLENYLIKDNCLRAIYANLSVY